jgi:hypothetical protein
VFSFFKRTRSQALSKGDAEGIAKNLHVEFVLERSGQGFNEANSLRPEARYVFGAKVDRYREAMLLATLNTEAQTHRKWKRVLWCCEERILGKIPPESNDERLKAIKSAMADLARLLNTDSKQELTWGVEWFRDIGDDAIVKNPVDLFLFVSTWMDEYIVLVKTIAQIRQKLKERDKGN